MKHLFYCLFIILLCVSCSRDDDSITQENVDSSFVVTRAGGMLDLVLSGHTVSISWDKPFGYGVGISVEVFDESSGTSFGSFSSKEDSGRGTFSLTGASYFPNTLPLRARVRAIPPYGFSRESTTVSILNTNTDPNNPYPENVPCNHSSISGSPSLGIEIDRNCTHIKLYRGINRSGLLVFKLGIGILERYDPVTGQAIYDSEETIQSSGFGPAPSPDGNATNLLQFNLPAMIRFADRSEATASLEVRIYDITCRKLGHSGSFPECTNYYKYEIKNVPLASLPKYVNMSVVKEKGPITWP